jgi:PAS domain S-box-containing protein
MELLKKHQIHFKWALLGASLILLALWFWQFPLNPPFDLQDVAIEGLILASVVAGYLYVMRFANHWIELGFGLYVIGLLIDFLDELTKEPDLINTQIEGFIIITALFIIVFGFSIAYRTFKEDLDRAAEREEKVRKSEDKYRNLIENISEAVCEINEQGRFTYVSPKIRELLGYAPEEMTGRSFAEFCSGDLMPVMPGSGQEGSPEREPFTLLEHTCRHKEGHEVILQINGTPFAENGAFCGYRIVSRDVTEKKQAEDALRATNKKLQLLSSITRHDVLNMVMVLRASNELVRENADDEERVAVLERERQAIDRIEELIHFTSIYQDIGIASPTWQNVQMVASTAAAKFNLNGITTDIRLEGREIYADPLLEKVFYNLFDNILRHGNGLSEISLSAADREDMLVITVEDDGMGIPDTEKEKIFLRKYGKNTGLGLFLSREILAITGIGIRETGTAGRGARFEILVPAHASRRT